MDTDNLKSIAAAAVLDEVRSGMILGLGTGSTATKFVELLGRALQEGRFHEIRGVCTSRTTEELATRSGVAISDLASVTHIDLAVDGADEVDPQLRLIKGRGGALLREKIVEQAARRFIVIADQTKQVERLGVGRLPVETVRFATAYLHARWQEASLDPQLRSAGEEPFVTDEGHHIVDIIVPADRDIAELVDWLRRQAGVVETGFFPDEASEVLIASGSGVHRLTR